MLKIEWNTVSDNFEHNFVIGNVESIWRLHFLLTHLDQTKLGGSYPKNIKVFNCINSAHIFIIHERISTCYGI